MKSIRIRNIKSFVDSGTIEIKPITIFVGKNSCGKSSLLRFPAVLSQTFLARIESPLAFFGQFVDYGSFESVLHKEKGTENTQNEIQFEVGYNISAEDFFSYLNRFIKEKEFKRVRQYMGDSFDVCMEVTIDKPDKQLLMKSLNVYYENRLLCSFNRTSKHESIYKYTVYLNFTEDGIYEKLNSVNICIEDFIYFIPVFDEEEVLGEFECNNNEAIDSELEMEQEIEIFKNQIDYASEIVRIITDSIWADAQCISYIGPFRENPKRIYRDTEDETRDVGAKGENLSIILLRESEKENGQINEISKWLKKHYGYSLEIGSSINGYFGILLVDENGVKSNIMDVGYGISQVLPIVTQLIRTTYVKNRVGLDIHDEIVLLEQPELHLHPAAQASLAELIMYSVKEKKEQKILIETHSEHLIRKLQVLVAKKEILPDMIAVYSVEKKENGQATVNKMDLNESGRFVTRWPSGFFDKSHELAAELREINSTRE